VGPRDDPDELEESKISCSCRDFNLQRPARSPVTILRYHQTMLSPSSHVYCSILTKLIGNAKNHTTTISFLDLKIR